MVDLATIPDSPREPSLLLDRAAVAHLIDVSPRTLDRLVSTGAFPPPAIRLSSKLVRYSRAQVVDWIVEKSGVAGGNRVGK